MTQISNLPALTTASGGVIFPVVAGNSTKKATFEQIKQYVALSAPVQTVAGRTGTVVLSYSDVSGLSTVSTSGQYSDLLGKPILEFSSLTNGSYTLTLDNAGVVALPTEGFLGYGYLGPGVDLLASTSSVYVELNYNNNAFIYLASEDNGGTAYAGIQCYNTLTNNVQWLFDSIGNLYLPFNGDIIDSVTGLSKFALPIATNDTLGAVIVGDGLIINTATGVLSAGAISTVRTTATYFTLNTGETSDHLTTGNGTAGWEISRGTGPSALIQYDEKVYVGNGLTATTGAFIFEHRGTGNKLFLYVGGLRTDPGYGEFNFLGTENPTCVLSVRGTSHYETYVTDNDHIPNKKYVDDKAASYSYTLTTASNSTLGGIKVGSGLSIAGDGTLSVTGGGGGSSTLAGLTDVNLTTPSNGQVLSYNSSSGKWINSAGGGGLTSRTSVSTTTVTLTTGSSTSTFVIGGYKGYTLLSIQTSDAAWVTVYNSAANMTADASRTITSDPTPGSGVIAEVITTGAATQYFTPAVIGYSAESSPNTNIPIKIYNNTISSTTPLTITLTLIQLEA